MAYEVPALGTAGQVYTAAAHNIIVHDILAFRSIQNRFATARRTSGNLTLNSTNWADANTALDLTLNAAVGDVIEFSLSALSANEAVILMLDAVTVVAGSPVTSFCTGSAVVAATTEGVQAWYSPASVTSNLAGVAFLTLGAGDVSGGTVVLRLRYRTASATNKGLVALANNPLVVAAKNLGPVTT